MKNSPQASAVILLDTSGLLAALDSAQRAHAEAAASLTEATPPLLLSPFVLAELDYLPPHGSGKRRARASSARSSAASISSSCSPHPTSEKRSQSFSVTAISG